MLRKIIDEFLNREDKIKKYREGVQLLKEAGFIDLLRKFGYPDIIDSGTILMLWLLRPQGVMDFRTQ